jgi:hypothetical protein
MRHETLTGGRMVFLWAVALMAPIAWSVMLVSLFWLTHPVCQGSSRSVMWVTGGICALLAIAAGLFAGISLMRAGSPPERAGVAPFMQRLAIGMSAIFSLVILVSLVPVLLLTPCPV